jgi:hypothetical protein
MEGDRESWEEFAARAVSEASAVAQLSARARALTTGLESSTSEVQAQTMANHRNQLLLKTTGGGGGNDPFSVGAVGGGPGAPLTAHVGMHWTAGTTVVAGAGAAVGEGVATTAGTGTATAPPLYPSTTPSTTAATTLLPRLESHGPIPALLARPVQTTNNGAAPTDDPNATTFGAALHSLPPPVPSNHSSSTFTPPPPHHTPLHMSPGTVDAGYADARRRFANELEATAAERCGARFRQKLTLEDAIGPTPAPLEASMRVDQWHSSRVFTPLTG